MSRVEKPIVIPERRDGGLKAPKDFVRNVQGSSAGAGSGEFHVYRALRRKEYSRLKMMETKSKEELVMKQYQDKIDQIKKAEEEKTAKKREKRKKRQKGGKDAKKKKTDSEVDASQDDVDQEDKLASGNHSGEE
ncbi:hypothetical protein HDU67_000573 [Dinochytrium kinnereticum]|nr:hypothetical protein HDU67_000573 [Dinochytrium kinnereticum]